MENKQSEREIHIELHAHLYPKKANGHNTNYYLEDIIQAMDETKLDVLAMETLDGNIETYQNIYPQVIELLPDLRKKGYKAEHDDLAIKITDKMDADYYLLNGKEVSSSDGFHVIGVGSDKAKSNQPARYIIEQFLEDNALVVFDHPFANTNKVARQISKEKEKEVRKICEEYKGNIALEWNAYCLDLYWNFKKLFGGKNVNEEAIKLADNINESAGGLYSSALFPVVTDTDIHARSRGSLKALGTGRIKISKKDMDLSSGRKIIDSLKYNIFSGNYDNTYKNVSLGHFFRYFFLPYIFSKFYHRPRG